MRNLTATRDSVQPLPLAEHGSYPDIKFIKKFIPIGEIAVELGLDVTGSVARCWRSANHKNADRTPSVSFMKRDNVGRCFVCDDHAWSGIDLVQMVRGLSVREAVVWIAGRFDVPQIPKRKHLSRRGQSNTATRVGVSGFILEEVVRYGFWATLTSSQARILVVLVTFCPPGAGPMQISYRGIMRYAGVGSQSTVSRALKRFVRVGLLETHRNLAEGLRACSSYVLTLESPLFIEHIREVYSRHREEIEVEKQIRADQRRERRRTAGHPRTYTGKTSVQ